MKTSPFALAAIFLTVVLDAAGIGFVLPVMPDLFGAASATRAAGPAYGLFLSLYALLQFLFSPLLGSLSDRVGRKPVLSVSLAGTMINYAVMATLPPLWLLFVGRAIAGVTGANMSVASAYLADVSTPEQRAARFGQLSACFGIGFILGPAAGGLLREIGLNWPFIAAAVLAGLNLLLCLLVLPESRSAEPSMGRIDPFVGVREIGHFRFLAPLLMTSCLFALIGEVGGSIWIFYVRQKFHWQGLTVGLSVALFGLFHSLAQAFVVGPLSRRLGERNALLLGVACDMAAYIALALIEDGRLIFVLIPVLCLAGIGPSVLAGVISRKVGEDRQGQLQGVIASLASLAAIIGPTVFLTLYFALRDVFAGVSWVAGAALYLICLPVLLSRKTYE